MWIRLFDIKCIRFFHIKNPIWNVRVCCFYLSFFLSIMDWHAGRNTPCRAPEDLGTCRHYGQLSKCSTLIGTTGMYSFVHSAASVNQSIQSPYRYIVFLSVSSIQSPNDIPNISTIFAAICTINGLGFADGNFNFPFSEVSFDFVMIFRQCILNLS